MAVWHRALSGTEVGELYRGGQGVSLGASLDDADGDGLPTGWERRFQLNEALDDSQDDLDGDGLSNQEEYRIGTDPTERDSDADALEDGVETGTGIFVSLVDTGSHPLVVDTDGDGRSDRVEVVEGTDPVSPDTDGDQFSDGHELDIGLDPLHADPGDGATLGKGLVAHWDFDGDLEARVGGYLGKIVENANFSRGQFGQSVSLSPLGRIDLLDGPNEALEFEGKSFSVSVWIEADSPQLGALNPFLNMGEGSRGS